LLGLERELKLARSIQESLVPSVFPAHPRFEVFGSMVPAAAVGGDLFDFFLLDEHRLALTIGDISGKGIGAALFMAVSRTVLRVAGRKGLSAPESLQEVNRHLCADTTNGLFLTCFYGILDLATGELQYSCAGHNPPYLVRSESSGARVQALSEAGAMPLAMFDTAEYGAATIGLMPGDSLLLYTDGVTESMNAALEPYDDARLVALLREQGSGLPVRDLVARVVGAAQAFAEGTPPSDDMTVLAIRYLG
jgi:sigma-B regulation protein RsbU (phosphoserine phosphatase)